MLQVQPFDLAGHEVRLESELKKLLSDHRADSLGLSPTQWDDNLAFLLMSSLAAYEQEVLTGQSAAHNEDFQQCIRRSIPSGCMFKGFPQHHRYSLCSVLPLPDQCNMCMFVHVALHAILHICLQALFRWHNIKLHHPTEIACSTTHFL